MKPIDFDSTKEEGAIVSGPPNTTHQGDSAVQDAGINNITDLTESKLAANNVINWNPNPESAALVISRQFMEKDLAASGINPALLPDNACPLPIAPTAEYPNGRYHFPYPFSNGAMYRIKNNVVGSTLPKSGEGRIQQRYDSPSSGQVGTWANAPYIVEVPRAGPLLIAEGPKKTLSLVVNGLQTVGLAGAFNYMNGNAHSEPRGLNAFIVRHLTAWLALRSDDDPLVIVPDPDAFGRPDIGRPYWHMISLIQEAFPGLPVICKVFPDKIDDLIGRHGFEIAWSMGEDKQPLSCLAVPLIDIARHPVFPRPLLVTHAMKKDKDVSYVSIQEVNAANLLANHPRVAGRFSFDLSRNTTELDSKLVTEPAAFIQKVAELLAHDLGFQHNGHVLATTQLKSAMAGLVQSCGFYPMQRLVATLPEWDGVTRLDDLGVRHCGFPDTEWSRLWMRSFVLFTLRRGIDVGCDCRLLWLLQGAQQIGKSRLPSTVFGRGMSSIIKVSDIKKQDELARRLYQAGHVAILDDMDAFTRQEQAMLKGLVSAGSNDMPEQIRFLYLGEISRVRHFTLYATANHFDVLNDDLSGNTRYLAVQSQNAKSQVFDYEAIEKNRGQILAEACAGVKSMDAKAWVALENELGTKTGNESEWAVQENENHMRYRTVLEEVLKDARDKDGIHEKDSSFAAKGPYLNQDVYAVKTAYLKHYVGERYRGSWNHDIASWLSSEGWENSNQKAVLKRKQCWWMSVATATERYNLA